MQSLDYYEITWDVARRAGLAETQLLKESPELSLPDTTIAAAAMEYNLTLITANVKQSMPQLKFYGLNR